MKIGTPIIEDPRDRSGFVDEGFDYFINAHGAPADGLLYACPCCRYPTLATRGSFDVCPICAWEDDGQDSHDADRVRGGPNGIHSLTAARVHYSLTEASGSELSPYVRSATDEEKQWRKHDD